MPTLNYKQVGGLLLLAIGLTCGITLLLEKTGEYINCRADWILQEDGTYICPKTNAQHFCYEIEDRGSGWYRCWLGKVVETESPPEEPIFKEAIHVDANGGRFTCEVLNGEVWSYSKCIKDDNKAAYLGELI